jgi:Leucine-rich repeat (LRR) protein
MLPPRGPHLVATAFLLCWAICIACTSRPALGDETGPTIAAIRAAGGTVTLAADGHITGVDLAASRTPADEKLARAVLRLPRLEVLRLSLNAISDETLAQLAAQKRLIELVLRDIPLTDAQIGRLLGNLPRLQRLALRRVSGVSDAGLDALASLGQLEVLALVEMDISGKALAKLGRLDRLRSLDVRKCEGLKADDYRLLPALKSLRELKICGPSTTDQAMEAVAAMPALESLVLEDSPVTADGLQRLAAVGGLAARLRSLTFTRCYGVTDDTLRIVAAMPRLQSLSIRKCPVTGDFLTRWADVPAEKLPQLRALVVNGAFLSDKAFAVLPRFAPSLKRLDLSRVTLSPEALKVIGELAGLETLLLAECSLSDEAIGPIANLKKLTTLDLSGNYGVTDKSAGLLRALPRLKRLETKKTGMTLHTP